MIGTMVSHYRILATLGEGGMGIVYKAQDADLDRIVALKFLPRDLSPDDADTARFLQEARAASALNHPNICAIHALGEHTRERFIDMEYVEGRTLRKAIEDGRLKIEDCKAYALQIAEALKEAHSHGIVHRDIKPENIMVTLQDRIKVMDFGLATLAGDLRRTSTSGTAGTLAYMAPEQIAGGEADMRSDIFSFGVVLYEMLAGRLPFRGDHQAAMMYSIVNEDPAPIGMRVPDIDPALARTVHRALAKDPKDRYHNMQEMLTDLRPLMNATPHGASSPLTRNPSILTLRKLRPKLLWSLAGIVAIILAALTSIALWHNEGTPASSPNTASLAVVYFENRTHEKDLDKNLVSMLITNLSRNGGLKVVSEQRLYDMLRSMGKEDEADLGRKNASEVAQRAAAHTMMVGQILEVGSQWSFQANLIDVVTGNVTHSTHLETPPKPEEVFGVADKFATVVGGWFATSLAEPVSITATATASYDAYKFYERGLKAGYRFEYNDAIENYASAVKLDPTFALAYLEMAKWHVIFGTFSPFPDKGLVLARDEIARAKQYGADLSGVHKRQIEWVEAMAHRDMRRIVLILKQWREEAPDDKFAQAWGGGMGLWLEGDHEGSIRSYERAIELDRTYADAYNQLAYVSAAFGQYDKALAASRAYTALIPDAVNGYDSGIDVCIMAGRFEDALRLVDEVQRRFPSGFQTRRAQIFSMMGRGDKAREALVPMEHTDELAVASMRRQTALSYVAEGRFRDAASVLEQDISRSRDRGQKALMRSRYWDLARVYLAQARYDAALRALDSVMALRPATLTGPFDPWPMLRAYYEGRCLLGKNEIDRAEAKAGELRAIAGSKDGDELYLNYVEDLMAEIALARHNTDQASAALARVQPLHRTFFPRCRILQARVNVLNGRKEAALGILDRTYNFIWAAHSMVGGDPLEFWIERAQLDLYKAQALEHFGDKAGAVKWYEKAVRTWRNADKDYAPLVDAQARLAKLKGGPG